VDPEERRYRQQSIVRLLIMAVGTAVVAVGAVRADSVFLWLLAVVGIGMTVFVARLTFGGTR